MRFSTSAISVLLGVIATPFYSLGKLVKMRYNTHGIAKARLSLIDDRIHFLQIVE